MEKSLPNAAHHPPVGHSNAKLVSQQSMEITYDKTQQWLKNCHLSNERSDFEFAYCDTFTTYVDFIEQI